MNRITCLVFATSLLFLIESCCNCTNEEQKFTSEELEWIPVGEIGDSLLFSNDNGETKTLYVNYRQESFSEKECSGPCCVCPEDNSAFYDFQFTGEQIPNTIGIQEGLTINLIKSKNIFQKTFSWSCPYGSFQDFDYSIDTLTINKKLYKDIFVKELDVCHIRKIFYCKGIGLIRFDYDDDKWERLE
jgi:hypothetical protein